MVHLKLHPHGQSPVAYQSNHEFSFRYFGPFKILQRIESVSYKLDLPADAKIHPAIHVSQLKKHFLGPQFSSDLSTACTDPLESLQPEEILDRLLFPKGTSTVAIVASCYGNRGRGAGYQAPISSFIILGSSCYLTRGNITGLEHRSTEKDIKEH